MLNFYISFINQLAPRQEPVLDSAKYTAADVRIVSPLSHLFLISFILTFWHLDFTHPQLPLK